MINPNEPANPGESDNQYFFGLTKREYIATKIAAAVIGSHLPQMVSRERIQGILQSCIDLTDVLIVALNETESK